GKYPEFIAFDGRIHIDYTPAQLERIAFVSLPFAAYSKWNGKGSLIEADKRNVADAIEKVHAIDRKIRFWGTPDGITAWNTLHKMGVDIINTDKIERCTEFFSDFEKKEFSQL